MGGGEREKTGKPGAGEGRRVDSGVGVEKGGGRMGEPEPLREERGEEL